MKETLSECKFHVLSGVALDSADGKDISIIKKQGKVKALEEEIFYRKYIIVTALHFPLTFTTTCLDVMDNENLLR